MGLYRFVANMNPVGNLLSTESLPNKPYNLNFPKRQV